MERNGENAGMKQYGALFLLIRKADWGGWAATINVPADQPTIQAGIDASTSGDTVLVAPGTYVENITFNGHNIVLASRFILTGDTADLPPLSVPATMIGFPPLQAASGGRRA